MNALNRVLYLVLALVVIAGCAQTTVTSRDPYTGGRIARPNRIIVHDFAASHADVPPGSAVARSRSKLPAHVNRQCRCGMDASARNSTSCPFRGVRVATHRSEISNGSGPVARDLEPRASGARSVPGSTTAMRSGATA